MVRAKCSRQEQHEGSPFEKERKGCSMNDRLDMLSTAVKDFRAEGVSPLFSRHAAARLGLHLSLRPGTVVIRNA